MPSVADDGELGVLLAIRCGWRAAKLVGYAVLVVWLNLAVDGGRNSLFTRVFIYATIMCL